MRSMKVVRPRRRVIDEVDLRSPSGRKLPF
jgi:hypothetical protein